MKAISGKRFASIAEARGWRLVRINGSHHTFGTPRKFTSTTTMLWPTDTNKPQLLQP